MFICSQDYNDAHDKHHCCIKCYGAQLFVLLEGVRSRLDGRGLLCVSELRACGQFARVLRLCELLVVELRGELRGEDHCGGVDMQAEIALKLPLRE